MNLYTIQQHDPDDAPEDQANVLFNQFLHGLSPQRWAADAGQARKWNTMGDLTAFAEGHKLTGYRAVRLDPETFAVMEGLR